LINLNGNQQFVCLRGESGDVRTSLVTYCAPTISCARGFARWNVRDFRRRFIEITYRPFDRRRLPAIAFKIPRRSVGNGRRTVTKTRTQALSAVRNTPRPRKHKPATINAIYIYVVVVVVVVVIIARSFCIVFAGAACKARSARLTVVPARPIKIENKNKYTCCPACRPQTRVARVDNVPRPQI